MCERYRLLVTFHKLFKTQFMKKITASLYLPIVFACLLFTTYSCKKAVQNDETFGNEPLAQAVVASNNIVDPGELVGDFDTGTPHLDQWHGIVCKDINFQYVAGNAAQIGIPVREGTKSAKFIVRPGDASPQTSGERSEANHYNDTWHGYTQETFDDDFYYGWSTFIPTNWVTPPGWAVFAQWHHRSYSLPPIVFNLINSSDIRIQFATGLLTGASTNINNYANHNGYTILPNATKGVWHDFIVHIRFTPNPTGQMQVWHKLQSQPTFTQIFSQYNISTMQLYTSAAWPSLDNDAGLPDNTIQWGPGYVTTQNFLRLGLYRGNASFTNTIYHDNWARATSYNAILNNF